MRLRRVIEHVRDQNWTAIAIDFVIVVIGVFVGIQVANWNAERVDQRLTRRYLSDIASDIRSDLAELTRVDDSAMDRISASAYVLRRVGIAQTSSQVTISDSEVDDLFAGAGRMAIPEPAPPPERVRDRLWELAFGMYAFDMNRAAYDALIGSGKLELIDDPKIMRWLREYYYLVNALDRTQTRSILPMRNSAIEIGIGHGLSPGIPVAEDALIARVRESPALVASIATSRQNAGLMMLLSKVQRQKGEELLRMLESEQAP